MTTADKIKLVEACIDAKEKLELLEAAMKLSVGYDPESPWAQTVWKVFDRMTDATAAAIGDDGEWLAWFIWENGCGEKGYEARNGGKRKKIKTTRDLINLIEEGAKQ